MNEMTDVKIYFGKIARNLNYEDTKGLLRFVFDCSPVEGSLNSRWNLHLCQQPLDENFKVFECKDELECEWLATAMERVKEFVLSSGYILMMD
jgi:hypothetical protein